MRKHPLANCEECPLYEIGRFVPTQVPTTSNGVAFVGEAPGAVEAMQGKPFSGPSGKLLDKVMNHHGIVRNESLMTNACLCRPRDNATPTRGAIEACKPRLLAELQEHQITTAVALGNTAALALLGRDKVTQLRVGAPKDSPYGEFKVVPTLHPAAALRQGAMFPYIVTDIGKVFGSHELWTPPEYDVARGELEGVRAIERVIEARPTRLVIDIEVDIEKDTAHDHPNFYGMLCVGIAYAKGRVLVLDDSAMASRTVRNRLGLLLRSCPLTGQNIKFDLAGLFPLLGALEASFDTMYASYVFDERPGIHGLKYQAVELLGAPKYDDEILKFNPKANGYGVIPKDLLHKYNAYDCSVTWDLQDYYEAKFEKHPDLRRVHDFLVAAANQFIFVELNGITVDKEYLGELEIKYLKSLADIRQQLNELLASSSFEEKCFEKHRSVLVPGINPNSPMQVKAYLASRGIEVSTTDKDMMMKVKEKLEQIKRTDHEVYKFLELLLHHRREAKLYGTYVKGIRKRLYGGRVYPSFLLHGTTTGRPACRNPNVLNIPRESSIRRLFIPSKPDHVFGQTDYSQAELRVLSYLARDNYFRDIFNEGERDVFDELSSVLYPGITKEMAESARKGAWKDMRVRVKAFVYGLGYGREAFSIAQEFKLEPREADILKERFFSVIPEIVDFQNKVRSQVKAGRDLVTPLGRHRRFTLITKENLRDTMNEALAFLPQSTASDMCMAAFVASRKELKGIAYIRNVIYDALLWECHKDDASEVAKVVENNMLASAASVVGDYVKFAVETDIGKDWGAC